MTGLERRYRRLLRIYPAAHRADYEEEMIGVLMSGAGPGRRLPTPGDAFDLLRAGLTARLGHHRHTRRGTGWRDAAAVTAPCAALVMAAPPIGKVLDGVLMWGHGDPLRAYGVDGLLMLDPVLRAVAWLLVAVAALLGRTRAAVLLAAAGVLVQAATVVWWAGLDPWQALRLGWGLALAVVVLALFALAMSGRPARAVLGGRGLALIAGALAAAAGIRALTWTAWLSINAGLELLHWVPCLVLGAAAAAAGPVVRGRVLVLSAVVVAVPLAFYQLEVSAHWGFSYDLTREIVTGAVLVLVLTPVVVLAAGVTLLGVTERLAVRGHGHVRAHE